MTAQENTLDTCGCCEGIIKQTPVPAANAPGLTTLAYRVGTHGRFKASMLAALAGSGVRRRLATRADDDPSIALLDVCATMLDVLTFYQERIANEGYLRTASERRSVLELARAIGYELAPGVAASTFLAFELETALPPGQAIIPERTRAQSLPGQDEKPQSFETIETIDARAEWNRLRPQQAEARLPRHGDRRLYLQGLATNLKSGDTVLLIGDERKADPTSENWDFRRVTEVKPVPATDLLPAYTEVTLHRALGEFIPFVQPAQANPKVYALRTRANLFGYNAPDWRAMPKSTKASYLGMTEAELDLTTNRDMLLSAEWPDFNLAAVSGPSSTTGGTGLHGQYFATVGLTSQKLSRLDATINFDWQSGSPDSAIGANNFSVRWTGWVEPLVTETYTFITTSDDGVRLWVDGRLIIDNWTTHAATEDSANLALTAGRKYTIRLEYFEQGGAAVIKLEWSAPGLARAVIPTARLFPSNTQILHLDAVYSGIVRDSWIMLSAPDYQEVYEVEGAAEDARTKFTLSAKTTLLTIKGEGLFERFLDRLRQVAVFGQSEELPMAPTPISTLDEPVQGDRLVLDRRVTSLAAGRILLVSGRRMRVQAGSPLTLTAADGTQTVAVARDDSLILTQKPVALPAGNSRWTLTDHNGFTGTVDFATPLTQLPTALTYRVAQATDPLVTEVAVVKETTPDTDPTELVFETPLGHIYDRATVFLHANVARATQGETRNGVQGEGEVLGSGNGAQPFQKFNLKQKPLTYVSAPTASGVETTLEVRVNDVRWREAPSLYKLGPRDRAFITRHDDEGNVTVQFGDGINGARPPTGNENVTAAYRTGIGAEGMVKAGQISLLMTRPLGVAKVTNPLAPTGAADPQQREDARQNAPVTVLTLDRVVSLQDFEDFARAFAGVGKAQASQLWDGEQRLVHLTVASSVSNGVDYRIGAGSVLYQNLQLAVDGARDTVQPLRIDTYEPLFFRLAARVLVLPDYLPESVQAAVTHMLEEAFSFARRSFGQPVHAGAVMAFIQNVEGVEAVFLEKLYLRGQAETLTTPLVAQRARRQGDEIKPAQLLLLDSNGLVLTVETSA